MKKIFFATVLIITAPVLHAQYLQVIPKVKLQVYPKNFTPKFKDTSIITQLSLQQWQKKLSKSSMPVVALNSVRLSYLGNNGKGLDIYQANIDKMHVVRPDSAFHSTMPVANYIQQTVVIPPVKK
jgi:hypothetical protein